MCRVVQTFGHPDTAYVLSFALIMLNTDLHNPSVKHKMSREAFIKMNRGVSGGADVPSTTLAAMYNNIKVWLAHEVMQQWLRGLCAGVQEGSVCRVLPCTTCPLA